MLKDLLRQQSFSGHVLHRKTPTVTQPLFQRLCLILMLSLVGIGSAWAEEIVWNLKTWGTNNPLTGDGNVLVDPQVYTEGGCDLTIQLAKNANDKVDKDGVYFNGKFTTSSSTKTRVMSFIAPVDGTLTVSYYTGNETKHAFIHSAFGVTDEVLAKSSATSGIIEAEVTRGTTYYIYSGNSCRFSEVRLTYTKPEIAVTTQPVSSSVMQFTDLRLTVAAEATNGASCTYQWQSCSAENGGYANIDGATSATYRPTNTSVTQNPTWYHCVVSADGCDDETTDNVSVKFNAGTDAIGSLELISEKYTYIPSAAIPLNTLAADRHIFCVAGGCPYTNNGLNVKDNRYIAIKVAAGAKIKITAGNHSTSETARNIRLYKDSNNKNESTQAVAKGETKTLSETIGGEDAVYYIDADADLYIKSIVVTFEDEYNITKGTTTGGDISFSEASATEGANITVTPTPMDGKEFDYLVLNYNEEAVKVYTTTFAMPAYDVVVDAVFKDAGTIGHTDNSTGFMGQLSNPIVIGDGQTVTVNFTNHNNNDNYPDDAVWYNWLAQLCSANGARTYATLRADAFYWLDGQEGSPTNKSWGAEFPRHMNGSTVSLKVTRIGDKIYYHADITLNDGSKATVDHQDTYEGITDFAIRLTVDHSYITGISSSTEANKILKVNGSGATITSVTVGGEDVTVYATNAGVQIPTGKTIVIKATAKDGYVMKVWKTTGAIGEAMVGNDGVNPPVYTYTVTSIDEIATVTAKAELQPTFATSEGDIYYSLNVVSSESLLVEHQKSTGDYDILAYATVVGGKTTLYNGHSSENSEMLYGPTKAVSLNGSSASYIKVELLEGNSIDPKTVQVGDVISFTGDGEMYINKTNSTTGAVTTSDKVYTVQAGDAIVGASTLYFFKDQIKGATIQSLNITRTDTKSNITRFSPKGGTVKNPLVVGQTNTPTLYIAPFVGGETNLSASDFEVSVDDESILTAGLHTGTPNNTIVNTNCRQVILDVHALAAGTARVTIRFKGNDQFKEYTTYVDYTVNAVSTYTVAANTNNADYGTVSVDITSVQGGGNATFTATANSGYKFVNWTDANGNVTSTLNPYTMNDINANVTLTANFATDGVVTATATFPVSVMQTFGKDSQNTDANGKVTIATTSADVQAQNTASGTKVRPAGVFTITPAAGVTIKKIEISTDQTTRNLSCSPEATVSNDGSTWTYVVNSDGTITFHGNSNGNIYVTAINVTYEYEDAVSTQYLAAFPANSSINDYVGVGGNVPALTVTANGASVDAANYTVAYTSTNPSIVTVNPSTGAYTLVAAGSASIIATVTPTNASITGSTATLPITVKALEPMEIDVDNLIVHSNDADYEIPTVSVSINGVIIPANGYTLSYSSTGDNIVIINGTRLSLSGSARNWTAGKDVVTVTVTPTEETKELYHCVNSADQQFTVEVVQAGSLTTPEIEFPDEISQNVGSTPTLIAHVLHDNNDITSGFTFYYEIIDPGTTSGADITSQGELTCGNDAGDITVRITATPKKEYQDQYAEATKDIFVHVKALNKFLNAAITPASQTIPVGKSFTPVISIQDANGNSLYDGEYSTKWVSSSSSVATVNAKGEITGEAAGKSKITILVTLDDYEDVTLIVDVTVTDPSVYLIPTTGVNVGSGHVVNDVPNIAMTYGGWIFGEVTGRGNKASTTFGENAHHWSGSLHDAAGSLPNFQYAIDGKNHENPLDEWGANTAPEGTSIDFNHGYTPMDQMFCVPAEGAFMMFAPKVNGTVTAHVLQNSVFDNGGWDSSKKLDKVDYNPNRRVFVIDETGTRIDNVRAHLDVATAKMPKSSAPSGHDLYQKPVNNIRLYKKLFDGVDTSDWTDEQLTSAMNQKLKADFVDVPDFHVTDGEITDFVNGLYQRTKNVGKDNLVGGWVVLAKAPVTYTFEVKAGKTYYLYNFGSKISPFGYEFKADDKVVIDDPIAFDETNNNAVIASAPNHIVSVSLNRKFKRNQWNACVLPFSLNKQQVDAIFGHTYDKNHPEGTQILYFEKVEGNTIYYTRHAYNHIVAGKPFLIMPSDDDAVTTDGEGNILLNTANIADFPYVTIENTAPADWGRDIEHASYYWTSSYNVQDIVTNDYYLNSEGSLVMRSGDSRIQAFRGFLKMKQKDPSQQDPSQQTAKLSRVAFYSIFDDSESKLPTYIENVMMDENGNLVNTPTSGKIYNTNGQLVTSDPTLLYSLPKGIYLLNGKKYVVK